MFCSTAALDTFSCSVSGIGQVRTSIATAVVNAFIVLIDAFGTNAVSPLATRSPVCLQAASRQFDTMSALSEFLRLRIRAEEIRDLLLGGPAIRNQLIDVARPQQRLTGRAMDEARRMHGKRPRSR